MKVLASLVYLLILEAIGKFATIIAGIHNIPYQYSWWVYAFVDTWIYILIAVGFILWRIITFAINPKKHAWSI